jgi:uncharacterized protein
MKYLLLLFSLAIGQAHATSFDCSKAATPDEHAVCSDPQLSQLDDLVARAFGQAKVGSPGDQEGSAVAYARLFLKDRRACAADRSCIFGSYVAVLTTYRDLGAKEPVPSWISASSIAGGRAASNGPLPTRIGQCSTTQVAEVTPRLDPGHPPTSQDFDSGTAINYRNDGQQVSYEREAALLSSKPGDGVLMCLVAIPHNCPPGDDRGRVYTVTNTRTGATWTLPDSQHSCGGA